MFKKDVKYVIGGAGQTGTLVGYLFKPDMPDKFAHCIADLDGVAKHFFEEENLKKFSEAIPIKIFEKKLYKVAHKDSEGWNVSVFEYESIEDYCNKNHIKVGSRPMHLLKD
jgi:hypothetical protein